MTGCPALGRGHLSCRLHREVRRSCIRPALLPEEGYDSILSLANGDLFAISSIEGLDEEIAGELISRAKEYIDEAKLIKKED